MSTDPTRGSILPKPLLEPRKQEELEHYDEIYSKKIEFTNLQVRDQLLFDSEEAFRKLIADFAPGCSVLEIGCGLGEHARLAASCRAESVIGVDFSPMAVEQAIAAAKNESLSDRLKFEVADIETMQFANSTFDVIINHEVFSSLDQLRAFKELKRVLKPGGVVLSIESFGHNPIFNLNRQRNASRGVRSRWAVEHIVTEDVLREATKFFEITSVKYFHFLIVLLGPLLLRMPKSPRQILASIFVLLDNALLSIPFLRKYCFKVVMVWKSKACAE